MNISTTQKRRFLNNIYKLIYSSGQKPSEQEVRKAFNEYFSVNQPGYPIKVDYDLLRTSNKTNVDLLNQIMTNTIYNVDILYDTILDNNEELFSIVTSLNKKLENLKKKRLQLESKVDDLIFMNNNSDGYFYSFTENFISADKLDLSLTDSAFFDPKLRNVTISKLKSEQFNVMTVDNLNGNNVNFEVTTNGQKLVQSIDKTNFNNIFDGLTDTYWEHSVSLGNPQPVSLTISIPVNKTSILSKVDGILFTSSPVNIMMRAIYSDPEKPNEIKTKTSRSDYDAFSFAIPADSYSTIEIVLYKNEPDYIDQNSSSPYVYKFGLREMIIGSKYYAKSGILVSAPISIATKTNSNLIIDAISMDVKEQVVPGTSVNYYVAANNPTAQNINDYNWIPVSPKGSESSGYNPVVYLDGSTRNNVYISNTPEDDELKYIPINSSAVNANELNPNNKIYSGKNAYRITALSSEENYLNPILLGGVDCLKHNYLIYPGASTADGKYKDLEYWADVFNNRPASLLSNTLKEQIGSINPGINSYSSGYIETSIIRQGPANIIHNVSKSNPNFNLAIYLNGVLIADLPKGTATKAVEWEFKSGINKIIITYDKLVSGQVSFNVIEGLSLTRYGLIFVDYFNYLDPFEFQNKVNEDSYYFTIDTIFGRKEVLASRELSGKSNFIYTSNNPSAVNAVRYRIDLNRYEDPLASPIVESVRIKFKHRDA
jgi:hypothetical protein